jgi:hypothetical protein
MVRTKYIISYKLIQNSKKKQKSYGRSAGSKRWQFYTHIQAMKKSCLASQEYDFLNSTQDGL